MSDAHFPHFVENRPGKSQMRLFQELYTKYTTLDLTSPSDRSVAVLGLEERLSRVFRTDAQYGTVQNYLHRSLLWRRRQDKLHPIEYPDNRPIPSWSWMARYGQIEYMDIPFGEVEWNMSVQCDFSSRELSGICFNVLLNNIHNKEDLIFDDPEEGEKLTKVDCILLGKRYVAEVIPGQQGVQDHQEAHLGLYYVLLVVPVPADGRQNVYVRVGVGSFGVIALGRTLSRGQII